MVHFDACPEQVVAAQTLLAAKELIGRAAGKSWQIVLGLIGSGISSTI